MDGRMTGRTTYRRSLGSLLALLVALGAAPVVQASPDKAWTNVGAAGVIDDANIGQVMLDVSRARLAAGVVSATIRYNVTATEGLFLGPDKALTVRFYKPDNFTSVQARLWSDDIATGAHSVLTFFDSAGYAANPFATQAQTVNANLPNDFDFGAKVYWIEVTLTRLRDAQGVLRGDPRLELLKLVTN